MSAITYLQRALLVHDLQTLMAPEWESCFNKVLFPLLAKLLEPVSPQDPTGMEETRMRAATVLSKVFLHHLTPLLSLPTFTALWLTILDFMDKYMHVDKSDLLYEAIPESLKNMLLVMDSAQVFSSSDGYSQLWTITWDRINTFLPKLKEELFKSHPAVEVQARIPTKTAENTATSLDLQVLSALPPIQNEPASVRDPVMNRVTSIILQPPAVAPTHSVSTPVFTHLGQQILSTSVGSPIQHTPALSPISDTTTLQFPSHSVSVESMPNPLLYSQSQIAIPPVSLYSQPMSLYSQPQNTVPPVTLYSQSISTIPVYSQSQTITSLSSSVGISNTSSAANLTDQPTSCNTGVVIPAHYFHQEVGKQHLFSVSVPAPSPSSGMPSTGSSSGVACSTNMFLMNSNVVEGTNIPALHILSQPGGVSDQ